MNIDFRRFDTVGTQLVAVFHRLALFAIGAATVWAAAHTFFDVAQRGHATVQDLLLLFIYLEIGAMVGIYFNTNHMPVRFLIYIAITALTRHLVDLVTHPNNIYEILVIGVTTLLLATSVLIIRYASSRFPSDKQQTDLKTSDL